MRKAALYLLRKTIVPEKRFGVQRKMFRAAFNDDFLYHVLLAKLHDVALDIWFPYITTTILEKDCEKGDNSYGGIIIHVLVLRGTGNGTGSHRPVRPLFLREGSPFLPRLPVLSAWFPGGLFGVRGGSGVRQRAGKFLRLVFSGPAFPLRYRRRTEGPQDQRKIRGWL